MEEEKTRVNFGWSFYAAVFGFSWCVPVELSEEVSKQLETSLATGGSLEFLLLTMKCCGFSHSFSIIVGRIRRLALMNQFRSCTIVRPAPFASASFSALLAQCKIALNLLSMGGWRRWISQC